MIEAGFQGPIGADTTVSLARFRQLFPQTMQSGKSFTGRLGDIETRVATINEAVMMERAGLRLRFEVRFDSPSGSAWADLVGFDPVTGQPVRVVQFIRAQRARNGVIYFDDRETVNGRIIGQASGRQFPEFIVTGP